MPKAQDRHPLGQHARLVGLLGWPVAHSVSPQMHNAAFQEAGMACLYAALAVPPHLVGQAITGLNALGFVGANVTIPHKEAVMAHLDEIGPSARLVGAVNTIVAHADGRLVGHNTDGPGFVALLAEHGITAEGRRAVILGAGGAARAVAVHLALAGCTQVAVLARTLRRAQELIALVQAAVAGEQPAPRLLALPESGLDADRVLAAADIVVNCTPQGMDPEVAATPLPQIDRLPVGCAVVDTIYRPAQTRLLREAQARGLPAIGGLGMLVHQGALSWEYWFGRRGPAGVMLAAARRAVEERQ